MIIIEGPDGSGKSRLIQQLHEDLGLPIHPRAVRDKTGPEDPQGQGLWQWTYRDVISWPNTPPHLYDRHPLVSEYIYGPVVRGQSAPGFNQPSAHGLRRQMEQRCLLVLCLPPHEVYMANLEREVQMAGVREHAVQIYGLYEALISSWGGWRVTYDYVPFTHGDESQYQHVKMSARMQAAQWRTYSQTA